MRLLDKGAVVTGAASGIGKEIARAYRRALRRFDSNSHGRGVCGRLWSNPRGQSLISTSVVTPLRYPEAYLKRRCFGIWLVTN